jgi:phage terminase small subunit
MQARSRRTGITADRVVLELAELAFSNMFDFIEVHADGSVQIDLLRATRDRAAAIRVLVVKGCAEGSGNEGGSVKLTRIALCDKVKALDMLARHLGMYPMSERRSRRPKLSAR